MARYSILSIVPVAAVADDICLSQTRASAGALTLNGAKAATTLDFSRKLDFTSASNIAARVFTVVGTDAHGNSITETVTGINANTVQTTKYYLTVTSISVDASFSALTVTVGTSDDLATAILPLNYKDEVAAQVAVELVAGTATWSVQETYSSIQTQANTATVVWITPSAHSAKSASLSAPVDNHAIAIRLVTSAFSAPTLRLVVAQSGAA